MVITKDENRRWKYQLRLYRKALEASIPCITDPVILDAVLAYLMEGSTVKISKVLKTDIDFYVRNSIHHLHYFTYNQKYASMNFLINELEYYRKAIRSHIRKHKQETKKQHEKRNLV